MTPRVLAAVLYAVASVQAGDGAYVGSAACLVCHKKEAAAWTRASHGLHGRKDAAPEGGAAFAVGSRWMQAFLRRGAGGYHRVHPRCLDLRTRKWRDVGDVLDVIRGMRAGAERTTPEEVAARSFEHDCSGCHASQARLRLDLATGRMNARWTELSIGCEACHGPGRAHAAAWQRLDAGEPLPHLEKLSARASTGLCARCHGGPPAAPDFGPADAAHFVGDLLDREGFFADGAASGQVYQYAGFVRSPCHTKGGLTCVGCHDSHGGGLRHRGGDTLCIRCHENHAKRAHTHHDPREEGARCLNCHMPRVLNGLLAHQRDHRIANPLPASPHVPDACTACHKDRDKAWAARAYEKAWGPPPAATLEAIAAIHLARERNPRATPMLKRALTHADPFFRANAAYFLRDGASVRADPVPEVRLAGVFAARAADGDVLWATRDTEPRVRAAAYDALLARGEPPTRAMEATFRIAVRHVRALGRPRIALGTWHVEDGTPGEAVERFREAVAMRPRLEQAWIGLARAYRALDRENDARQADARRAEILEGLLRRRVQDEALLGETVDAWLSAGQPARAREVLMRALTHARDGSQRARIRAMLARFDAGGPK